MTENIIRLRDGSDGAFVCVHPASGLATAFRRLAPLLSGDVALYAFENAEPGGASPSISELAENYWKQLKAIARDGQLFFVGWSFGGVVSLEIASLAESAHCHVAGVVLLDSGPPHLIRASTSRPLHDLADLFGVPQSDLPAVTEKIPDTEILSLLVQILRRKDKMLQIEESDLSPFVKAYRWHYEAIRKPWTFKPQSAPIFLVRAQDERGWRMNAEDLGWSSALGFSPPIYWTPGTHNTLMSEGNAPELAGLLVSLFAQTRKVLSSSGSGEMA